MQSVKSIAAVATRFRSDDVAFVSAAKTSCSNENAFSSAAKASNCNEGGFIGALTVHGLWLVSIYAVVHTFFFDRTLSRAL